MSNDRELIWVPKKFADEYKQLESIEKQEAAVKKLIDDKRLDIDAEQELLSESLLRFKHTCLTHKIELRKVYQEQADALDALWHEMGDITSQINRHVEQIVQQISPAARHIAALKKEIQELHIYIPENLVRLAGQVSTMDATTKLLLRTLLNMHDAITVDTCWRCGSPLDHGGTNCTNSECQGHSE